MADTPASVDGTVQILTACITSAGAIILAIKALFTRAEPEAFRLAPTRELTERFSEFNESIATLNELVGTVKSLAGQVRDEALAGRSNGERIARLEYAVERVEVMLRDVSSQAHTIKHTTGNIASSVRAVPEVTAQKVQEKMDASNDASS